MAPKDVASGYNGEVRWTVVAMLVLAAGCGDGGLQGTPAQVVHAAAQRTLAERTARITEHGGGLTRKGELELAGNRMHLVEHGRFGYREYRFVGAAWYRSGGQIGPQGEDLANHWVRYPRATHRGQDHLRRYQLWVRGLRTATDVSALGDRRYRARVAGVRVELRLDGDGRLVRVDGGGTTYEYGGFGTRVSVRVPPPSEIYTGHD
jgi:hypothetical protein